MAVSAFFFFKSDGDVRAIYDAIVDDMGVRDNAARGLIYHWSAVVPEGLRVYDVWESEDDFENFAETKIAPLSAKHGFPPPFLEVSPVHEIVVGREIDHHGAGVVMEFDGDTRSLLRKVDEVNDRMKVTANPPEGLVFHWTAELDDGIRVIDHWRTRQDFDRFVQQRLGAAMKDGGAPEPRTTYYDVYNTIDRRVAARV